MPELTRPAATESAVPPAHEDPSSPAAMYEDLAGRLGDVVPAFELREKAALAVEINRLKGERRAVILGHNYMEPALFHSVPDYTGDSLYLSRIASAVEADLVIFCGVRFMAETAHILNPTRPVLLPSARGGCSLAAAITARDVRQLKAKYPGLPVVSYVNTYAEVKAESDYCCTSGNATAVIRRLLDQGVDRVIFIPDEYLSANTARECGMHFIVEDARHVHEPAAETPAAGTMISWAGRCEVHERFTVEDINAARRQFPDVVVLAHPECSPEVIEHADFSGSTTQMIRKVEQTERGRLMLLTECTMGDNIASRNPDREILRTCSIRCTHMNEITLEQTLDALRNDRFLIEVPEDVAGRARLALNRMIAIS